MIIKQTDKTTSKDSSRMEGTVPFKGITKVLLEE